MYREFVTARVARWFRGVNANGAARPPVARIEPLEGRCLLSGTLVNTPVLDPTGTTLSQVAGVRFTADLGNFTSSDSQADLKATIDWGDGRTSKGVIVADSLSPAGATNFEVDGMHKYKTSGIFPVEVIVKHHVPMSNQAATDVAVFNDLAIVNPATSLVTDTISGSISGSYYAAPLSGGGTEYVFQGGGSAGELGSVFAQGSVTLPGPSSPATTGGTLTLIAIDGNATRFGSVTLKLTSADVNSGSALDTLDFTVTGGSGLFAAATGITGTVNIALGTNGANTFTLNITSVMA